MRGLHKTDIEEIMEEALVKEKIEFVEQFPIRGKHGYILDYAIPELKIDIEVDGEHFHKIGNSRDRKRNWVLRNKGWVILRFRGNEIKTDIQSCIARIKETITRRKKEYENTM